MVGVKVLYCGHDAWFVADTVEIAGAVVVRANGPIEEMLVRPGDEATHHVSDFPGPNFWRPDLGVLVVPKESFKSLK